MIPALVPVPVLVPVPRDMAAIHSHGGPDPDHPMPDTGSTGFQADWITGVMLPVPEPRNREPMLAGVGMTGIAPFPSPACLIFRYLFRTRH